MKILFSIIALVGLFIFAGCDFSKSKINLLSPADESNIEYSYVTLEIEDSVSDVKADINGTEYIGVKNSDSFLIYNIPLHSGENNIKLIANGGNDTLDITLNSENKGIPPVYLSSNLQEGFEKLDALLTVNTSLSVSKYRLDKDNDGLFDDNSSNNNTFSVSYNNEGRFFPTATIESNGILYSTKKSLSLDVKAKPTSQALTDLANINAIDMQVFNHDKYYILSNDNNIYEINATTNQILNTIPVSNANNAEGFFVDAEENIFIANTGSNQILKLSKVNNYQQTMAFGTNGSANGELIQPKDIVVEDSGDNQKIYVLDAGNNRVQVFNYVGAYLYSFDGSTTPTGKLNNPTSMIGYFSQPLTIVDSGNGVIRTIQCSMNQPEHELSVIKDGISSDLGKVTLGSDLIVADKANKRILFFQNNYLLKKSIDVDNTPNIAITQDGLSLIVSNEGISGLENLQIQIDPKGAEPIDIAKEFVQALIDGNRNKVEELLGYSQELIDLIYGDQANLNQAIELYKQITTWSQTYHNTSYATVKAHIKTSSDEFDATFELKVANSQTSRAWIVKKFY